MCHQTVSLVARHLEANGIPTIVMGCAKDIVEHVGARIAMVGEAAVLFSPAASAEPVLLASSNGPDSF